MFKLGRRCFVLAVATTLLSMAQAAEAQSIRYFVRQSTGLFEILGTNTGGRFVVAPTGESIFISGVGNLPVRGYTDRAKRTETVYARGQGSGAATLTVTRTDQRGRLYTLFSVGITLPGNSPAIVIPADPNWDNPTAMITQSGRVVTRRLPLGTRP